MLQSQLFYAANMCFNAIHKNKILTEISEFTLCSLFGYDFCPLDIALP